MPNVAGGRSLEPGPSRQPLRERPFPPVQSYCVAQRERLRMERRHVSSASMTSKHPVRMSAELKAGVLTLCLTALAAASSGGCASRAAAPSTAVTSGDWSAVEALAARSKVVVERHRGSAVSGASRAVTAASIEIDTADGAVVVARGDVARVLRTRSLAGKGAARGLAIGGIAGVLQALLLTKSDRLVFAGIFSAVWAPLGAVIGAIHGAGTHETSVVYSAMTATPLPISRKEPARRLSPDGARLMRPS